MLWEWLKDIFARNKESLIEWRLYNGLYAPLFSYDMSVNVFKALCELWCHTTNTFCTKSCDMSMSLWDMRVIGGLPAYGSCYEEIIPSARELFSIGQDKKPLETCTFLFSAFHRLCQGVNGVVQLAASKWIRFWFRGPHVYTTSPQRHNTKRVKAPTLISCLSGTIVPHSS